MVTFEEAKKKAKRLYPEIDNCIEYDDAYVFGESDCIAFGPEPIVILKKNGKAIYMTEYIEISDMSGEKDLGKI